MGSSDPLSPPERGMLTAVTKLLKDGAGLERLKRVLGEELLGALYGITDRALVAATLLPADAGGAEAIYQLLPLSRMVDVKPELVDTATSLLDSQPEIKAALVAADAHATASLSRPGGRLKGMIGGVTAFRRANALKLASL